jgi:hypothetical protein
VTASTIIAILSRAIARNSSPTRVSNYEIISNCLDSMAEAEPSGGVTPTPPMTPAKMRARRTKQDRAADHVRDVRAANALRLQAAQRKVADV